MSLPRPIVPGRVYLLTRRCSQRQFLLRPDDKTNQAFLYCLGEAAQRFEIQIIGWLAMSNHYHAVVYDPHGRVPEFACHFHQMLAKSLNVRWKRWENLWSTEPPTYTWLADPSAMFDKLLYVFLNPVVGRLVDAVAQWPGSSSWNQLDGRSRVVRRPHFFFRPNGVMPKTVTIKTVVPPGFEEAHDAWAARVREAVLESERGARNKLIAEGKSVLGRKSVRATSAFDKPKTSEPRRTMRPTIACKDEGRRLDAIRALRQFRAAYRDAWHRFVEGMRNIVFPAGTFGLRRLGVLVAAPT